MTLPLKSSHLLLEEQSFIREHWSHFRYIDIDMYNLKGYILHLSSESSIGTRPLFVMEIYQCFSV